MNDKAALAQLKTNMFAMRVLKDRCATIAGEIATLNRQWEIRRAQLIHVDATIHLLDPNVDLDSLLNKRTMKHLRLFRQGELGRLILGMLRDEDSQPVSFPAIVTAIMTQREIDKAARRTIVARVHSNLGYMERCGKSAGRGEARVSGGCLPDSNHWEGAEKRAPHRA